MAARFPQGKQPKFPVRCIGTRKLANLMFTYIPFRENYFPFCETVTPFLWELLSFFVRIMPPFGGNDFPFSENDFPFCGNDFPSSETRIPICENGSHPSELFLFFFPTWWQTPHYRWFDVIVPPRHSALYIMCTQGSDELTCRVCVYMSVFCMLSCCFCTHWEHFGSSIGYLVHPVVDFCTD